METKRQVIRQLSSDVVRLIAAGEVIERPHSVVKELVENSLDAGANQIEIRLVNGGLVSIAVRDNGSGIPADEVPLLLQRHTTSKIESEIDLGEIRSLGFRGEALYSVAAVSEFVLSTRSNDEEIGSRLTSDSSGRKIEQIPWPGGTQVESIDLFGRVPARRKFLRGSSAEYARVAELISAYSLAYPDVSFKVVHDRRETLRTPGSGKLVDALLAVYGSDITRRMFAVSYSDGSVRISGATSEPAVNRARRTDQIFFVNGRLIKDPSINASFERAYDPLLPPGRHPIAILKIECDPGEVDVNVHPHKREVRFANPGNVLGGVNRAVKEAISQGRALDGLSGGARSEPVEAPVIDSETGEVLPRVHDMPPPDRSLPYEPVWTLREKKHREMPDTWPRLPESPPGLEPEGRCTGSEPHVYLSFDELNLEEDLDPATSTLTFANTYLIYNQGKQVFLIDQHNLHERILYERFSAQGEFRSATSQTLLFPLQVRLTPALAALVVEFQPDLESLGFEIEEFSESLGGSQAFVLRAVPTELADSDPVSAFTDCLERASQDEEAKLPGGFKRAFLINLACKSAIKAGHPLTDQEVEFLVGHVGNTAFHTCPHGRPAVIKLDEEWFRRVFKRS
jgi:DNA mismatch repair protein MutL